MFFKHQILSDRSVLTSELNATIEDAYRVFSSYQLPLPLRVCYCNVCVSEEDARLLAETPLRKISVELLSEYTSSAHGYDEELHGTTLRYFLPRYFELIALNQAPYNNDLAQCLWRLGDADYRNTWPREEAAVIDRYFDALLVDKLRDVSVIKWPVGYRLGYPSDALLEMMVLGGGDLTRILASFDAAPDPAAALHIAALAEDLRYRNGRPEFSSVMIKRSHRACRAIGAFLANSRNVARLENAFYSLEGQPILQQIASDGQTLIAVMASISQAGGHA